MKVWIPVKPQLYGGIAFICLGVLILALNLSPLTQSIGAVSILLGSMSTLLWVSMWDFAKNEIDAMEHSDAPSDRRS